MGLEEYARTYKHRSYRVVAYYQKGKSITMAGCGETVSARYTYRFRDGSCTNKVHAEVALLKKLKNTPAIIHVRRFKADGTLSMAKPCKNCQFFLRRAGVKRVTYSGWDGLIHNLRL